MKRTMFWILLGAQVSHISFAQTASAPAIVPSEISKNPGLPQYLVYGRFLRWVNVLDKQATAAGATNTYQFAAPFARRAGLADAELDTMRGEARALEADLSSQDAKASAVVAAFRARARAAAQAGQSLPVAPPEVQNLQRQRTALLVQHYVKLRTALGQDTSSKLDQYLAREFAPHLSIKPAKAPQLAKTDSHQPAAFAAGPR